MYINKLYIFPLSHSFIPPGNLCVFLNSSSCPSNTLVLQHPRSSLDIILIHENDLSREIGVLGGIRPIRACKLPGFCKNLLPVPPEGSVKIEVREKTLHDLVGGSKITIFKGRPPARLQVSYGSPQEPILFPEQLILRLRLLF